MRHMRQVSFEKLNIFEKLSAYSRQTEQEENETFYAKGDCCDCCRPPKVPETDSFFYCIANHPCCCCGIIGCLFACWEQCFECCENCCGGSIKDNEKGQISDSNSWQCQRCGRTDYKKENLCEITSSSGLKYYLCHNCFHSGADEKNDRKKLKERKKELKNAYLQKNGGRIGKSEVDTDTVREDVSVILNQCKQCGKKFSSSSERCDITSPHGLNYFLCHSCFFDGARY